MGKHLTLRDPGRKPVAADRVSLVVAGEPVEIEVPVEAGPSTLQDLLPVFQELSDLFANRGAERAEAEGRTVSCRAGCAACCRQLVPVSDTEARALAALVDAMPEPRRGQVRQRFEAAIATLAPTGVLDRTVRPGENHAALATDYFRLRVACPFLEAEACSIYADRPLACREYLVTSPPQACGALDAAVIDNVPLDGAPSHALQTAGAGWLPLVVALRFAAAVPAPAPTRTGPELIDEVVGRL